MFGYVMVNEGELTPELKARYQSYYCGLCQVLKNKYGHIGQMTLTYDMTFLVVLLTALYESEGTTEEHRCLTHPTKKHPMFYNECTEYAADMNILLAYHNSLDDWMDDRNLVKLSTARLLKKQYQMLSQKYPDKVAALETYIAKVHEIEDLRSDDLDLNAGFTGELLGELFAFKDDTWSPVLKRLGFFLGKFIYLMDAYDDLEKDLKKQNYNPWAFYLKREDFDEYCHNILTMMIAECAREFERLPILKDAAILRNILYSGVWAKYNIIVQKKSKTGEKDNVRSI